MHVSRSELRVVLHFLNQMHVQWLGGIVVEGWEDTVLTWLKSELCSSRKRKKNQWQCVRPPLPYGHRKHPEFWWKIIENKSSILICFPPVSRDHLYCVFAFSLYFLIKTLKTPSHRLPAPPPAGCFHGSHPLPLEIEMTKTGLRIYCTVWKKENMYRDAGMSFSADSFFFFKLTIGLSNM